jgi:hypothetical protein
MRQKLTRRPTHTTIAAYLGLFIALGGTTYAATGDNFILGQSNSASSTTALSAGTTGAALRVTNTSTGPAGSFNVAAGHTPFTVNSAIKVANLNADRLDNKDITNWKMTSVINSVPGPLPVQGSFVSSGGKLLIMASGSGYRSSSNVHPGLIGMAVTLDGGNTVAFPYSFTNEFNSHKAFVPDFPVLTGPLLTPPAGTHTLKVEAAYDPAVCGDAANEGVTDFCTTTDSGDVFNVSVVEMP